MYNFKLMSIKNKLRTITLVTGIFTLLLASSTLISYELFANRRNMVADLFILADLAGINSAAALEFNDKKTAEENLASLKANPHIHLTYLFSKDGKLFANYIKEGEKQESLPSPETIMQATWVSKDAKKQLEDSFHFHDNYVGVFKKIVLSDKLIGIVYVQSDLEQLNERLLWASSITIVVLLVSLLLSFALAARLQQIITTPIYGLLKTMNIVSTERNYSIRQEKFSDDELGKLVDGFNQMLEQVENRDKELANASKEITALNIRLKAENLRMGAELDVTRRLQQMVLPKSAELDEIKTLDIAGFMEPACEVGGDYYDVLQHDGRVKIGIGDVTGHGLESGVLMMMVQTAVRTLLASNVTDVKTFLNILNQTIYANVKRMNTDKNLTLSLLDYEDGKLRLTGQHEEVLIVRNGGKVERIDTNDLGFMVGMEADISAFLSMLEIDLAPGDGIVLYTDGVTESRNANKKMYGVERLCEVISKNWDQNSTKIQQAVIADVREHIGTQKVLDDITLLVLKQKNKPV